MTYQTHQSEDLTLRPVARLGDSMVTQLRHPAPASVRIKLENMHQVDYANELLLARPNHWRLERGRG